MSDNAPQEDNGNAAAETSSPNDAWLKVLSGLMARYKVEIVSGYPADVAEHWLRHKISSGLVRGWHDPWLMFDDYVSAEEILHPFIKDRALAYSEIAINRPLDELCVLEIDLIEALAEEFPIAHPATGHEKLYSECCVWLAGHMRRSLERTAKSKSDWLKDAEAKFPGLSKRAFERAWSAAKSETGAANWGKPGRKSAR